MGIKSMEILLKHGANPNCEGFRTAEGRQRSSGIRVRRIEKGTLLGMALHHSTPEAAELLKKWGAKLEYCCYEIKEFRPEGSSTTRTEINVTVADPTKEFAAEQLNFATDSANSKAYTTSMTGQPVCIASPVSFQSIEEGSLTNAAVAALTGAPFLDMFGSSDRSVLGGDAWQGSASTATETLEPAVAAVAGGIAGQGSVSTATETLEPAGSAAQPSNMRSDHTQSHPARDKTRFRTAKLRFTQTRQHAARRKALQRNAMRRKRKTPRSHAMTHCVRFNEQR